MAKNGKPLLVIVGKWLLIETMNWIGQIGNLAIQPARLYCWNSGHMPALRNRASQAIPRPPSLDVSQSLAPPFVQAPGPFLRSAEPASLCLRKPLGYLSFRVQEHNGGIALGIYGDLDSVVSGYI